ncbi:MAG: hypothetical protein Q7U54_15475 [Bacteroidales bacterium]|nr:hypothetical protein [Bacteroidales bacterium]
MTSQNSARVLEIYKIGIDTRNATLETEVPSWPDCDSRHLHHSRFVYFEKETVVG